MDIESERQRHEKKQKEEYTNQLQSEGSGEFLYYL